jgi:hypothetical protein
MAKKQITVTRESSSGRNLKFHDNKSGDDLTRSQLVKKIEQGNYPEYHVRNINGIKTPVSNPDSSTNNNLD